MTIELGDGLQFPELLEIMKAVNVARLLAPELHQELLDGANALLNITSGLRAMPWLVAILPGGIGGQLDGAAKGLELMKGLLEA